MFVFDLTIINLFVFFLNGLFGFLLSEWGGYSLLCYSIVRGPQRRSQAEGCLNPWSIHPAP